MRNSLIHVASQRLAKEVSRHRLHFARCLLGGKYKVTDTGLVIDGAIRAIGQYAHRNRSRERDFVIDSNLVVDQGIASILGIALTDVAKIPKFYLALTSGATAPVAGLTAASFAATQGEIVSTSEGYTSATRPQWVPSAPAAGVVSSYANKAAYEMATATGVTVTGAGLLSDNGRGSTAGVLISAVKFDNPRQFFNGETFDLGYQVSLTD